MGQRTRSVRKSPPPARTPGSPAPLQYRRRSRVGWGWIDGIDAPLGEASELYRVRLSQGAVERQWSSSTPSLAIAGAELAAFATGPATLAVRQVGDRAASRETILTIIL